MSDNSKIKKNETNMTEPNDTKYLKKNKKCSFYNRK